MEGLFPDTSRITGQAWAARYRHRKAMLELFEKYQPNVIYPQLDAGPGVSQEEVRVALEKAENDFLTGSLLVPKALKDLTPEENERLQQKKAKTLFDMLMANARSVHLYAQKSMDQPGFPFPIGAWTAPGGHKPTDTELWEGQMSLWIVSDIARVIQVCNQVDNPTANVMTVPVKRLLSVRVLPNYIDINGAPPKPETASTKYTSTFALSPSGRTSNQVYDVRHVYLSMIVDWHRLPTFFDALSQVNFMSVLRMDMSDVDEYAALGEGYVYGTGDAVKVDMLIETLWMREWMLKLMPPEVKGARGVPGFKAVAGAAAAPAPAAPPSNGLPFNPQD
jgi:hypothetical protein